jgi:hypothetical protein
MAQIILHVAANDYVMLMILNNQLLEVSANLTLCRNGNL